MGSNWLLLYNERNNTVIQCSESNNTSFCRELDTTFSNSIKRDILPIAINKTKPPAYVQTDILEADAHVIVIGATSLSIQGKDYGIVTLDQADLNIFNTSKHEHGPMNIETGPENDIVFKSMMTHDNYVFVFFQLFHRNSNVHLGSRIGKLCKKVRGRVKSDGYYHSYEDIGLACNVNGEIFSIVEKAVLMNNKHFLVVLKNEQKNHFAVCIFPVASVTNKFISVRKNQLQCDHSKLGSHFKPNLSVPLSNCFKKRTLQCEGDTEFCADATGTFCNSRYYSTLLNGEHIQSSNSIYNSSKHLTAVKVQTLKNRSTSIVYFGTVDGDIIKLHVEQKDDDIFKKLQEKEVNVASSSIIDILIDDSDSIFVLTENKVIIGSCSFYDECTSCLKSPHTYCGWNFSSKQCEINDNSTDIIPHGDTCFEFENGQNKILVTVGHSLSVNFTTPHSLKDGAVTCMMSTSGKPIDISPRRRETKCVINDMETISPGNHTIELKLNGTVVDTKYIEFVTCGNLSSCQECTGFACGWNLADVQCRRNGYDIKKTEDCPIIVLNPDEFPRRIYNTYEDIELSLKWKKNIKVPSLSCEFISNSYTKWYNSTVNQNTDPVIVKCSRIISGDMDSKQQRNLFYDVKLLYKGKGEKSYINGMEKIELYTCSSNLSANQKCKECKQQQYPKECQWCREKSTCYSPTFEAEKCTSDLEEICPIKLYKVLPRTGPINGGTSVTLFGQNFVNSISVEFGRKKYNITTIKENKNQLEFTTLKVTGPLKIHNITITGNNKPFPQYNGSYAWFIFKKPELLDFLPKRSIKSGGRSIRIIGSNLDFCGRERFKIRFCNHILPCVKCSYIETTNDTALKCLSENVPTPMQFTRLEVIIDRDTILKINQSFTYVKDPSGFALSNETASVQQSGGAKITINGEGFNEVGQVTIDRVKKPCEIESDTFVECETPEYSGDRTLTGKVSDTVNVHFDGIEVPITIDYVGDPMFEKYEDIVEYEKGDSIEIKGRNILAGARWNDYTIHVGKTGLCYTEKEYVTDTNIKCWPPQFVPLTNYTDESLVFIHIKVGRIRKHIGVLKYTEEPNYQVIVISILVVTLVIAVCVGLGVTLRMRKKRKKAEKKFEFELQSVEERVRTNSREEFAETQIAIEDIQSDLVTSKVPFRDYQTYILLQLFPTQDPDSSSFLIDCQESYGGTDKRKVAIEKLDLLLENRFFLKSLVQTLDRPNTLTVREKSEFAAVLSIALLGKMRLFFDLVHCLLTDSIRSVRKRQHRGLFRRLDSITCRMMANWLQIVLFEQLQGQIGQQLFLLLKAVQTVMERGPVDAVTGHCKNTLCEEKLLKLRVDSVTFILNVDLNGNPDHCYQVKVLECDTISQVKRKCCAQIYKNKPTSEIPKFEDLELEWKEGYAGRLLLQDIDQTSELTDGHVRLNTLTHYKVKNNCRMALLYGVQQDDVYANSAGQSKSASFEDINLLMPGSSEIDEDRKKWHLSTSHVEEGPNLERDIGDIYLNRLFHTKLLLSKYTDSMFEGLLDPDCVSLPISYFNQTLDKIAKTNSVDTEVLQIWKNECYATRIWAPLIGKPQAAFDIHVPEHIEPVMDLLSQVFVECLTQAASRVNKESSTQRLLFHKDIERYRKSIDTFYNHMKPVADNDFWRTLDQISENQTADVKFSRQSTIHQLYNLFILKYRDKIVMDMEDMEESNDLQLGRKLEEIFELMDD